MQFCRTIARWSGLLLITLGGIPAGAMEAEGQAIAPITYYVQLIRGTDQQHRPEATWKPIGPNLSNRLSPFRWKNYWEVNRQVAAVEKGKVSRCRLSAEREVEIELVNP